MKRLPRAVFIRAALEREVEEMLEELGAPPLVERIFPKGWRNADDAGLAQLYDLCIRTYQEREREELAQAPPPDYRAIAAELAKSMGCNCDLDNWEPDRRTGHSWVCRIHKAAIARRAA